MLPAAVSVVCGAAAAVVLVTLPGAHAVDTVPSADAASAARPVGPETRIDADTLAELLRQGIGRLGADEPRVLSLGDDEVRWGARTLSNVRLGLDGTRGRHRLTLFADGPWATAIELVASAGSATAAAGASASTRRRWSCRRTGSV